MTQIAAGWNSQPLAQQSEKSSLPKKVYFAGAISDAGAYPCDVSLVAQDQAAALALFAWACGLVCAHLYRA
jgi:hypothetical protein